MSQMGSSQDYALGCPIGLGAALVESAARNNGVYIANYNTSSHFLLAGRQQEIESALAECQAAGAFSVTMFPCEAPLHTPLMAEVADNLATIVADYSFADPIIPLIEHVEQTCLTAAAIPDFLVNELCQPVWWERSYQSLLARGASHFVEVGSGNALKKFNRWIDSEAVAL
jgi:malonyl CoA-acyl carrier protein transacylase